MKIKFLIEGIDTDYPNGGMSLVKSAIAAIGGSVITRAPDAKQRYIDKKLPQFKKVMQADVEVATNDDEVRQLCEGVDALFVVPVGNKKWLTFEEALGGLSCKKIIFILGTGESRRCPGMVKSHIWDAYWSERPKIKEFMQGKGLVDKTKPYIIGNNIYELKCPYTVDELVVAKDVKSVISSCRFGSSKGSAHTLRIFDDIIKSGTDVKLAAWGWMPTEAGISFLSLIKSIPEMFEMWNTTGKLLARGAYTTDQIPDFMKSARLSIDLTAAKGDGNCFGDGGLQYGQAESIDWGALPLCDSNFYIGNEWDSMMLRLPRDDVKGISQLVQDELKTWDPHKHAQMIETGRKYLRDNLSRERFNDSMKRVLEAIA